MFLLLELELLVILAQLSLQRNNVFMPAYVYLMLLLCSYAVVEVEVRNRGEESFKPDIYGDSIIIERRINQSSSTTVLKDHQGLFGFLIKISLIHLKNLEFLVILMKKVLRPLGNWAVFERITVECICT